jgi:hypothetical protein
MQMLEAVAIVYSPIVPVPGYKTFRVKDAEIGSIGRCKAQGFHKHQCADGTPSYEEARHVRYVQDSAIKVIDLRKFK